MNIQSDKAVKAQPTAHNRAFRGAPPPTQVPAPRPKERSSARLLPRVSDKSLKRRGILSGDGTQFRRPDLDCAEN